MTMEHLYGYFSDKQVGDYKVKLHKDLFRLLIFKDPKTKEEFAEVNYERYFENIMRKINGLNELLFYPKEIVEMMVLLEAAVIETRKEELNYPAYRKLILDAHSLVDKLGDLGGDVYESELI